MDAHIAQYPLHVDEAGILKSQQLSVKPEHIAERGVKEIVITGVNIGDFGKSTGDTFTGCLKSLLKFRALKGSEYPQLNLTFLTDELIEMTAANEKILPHFHIPLQSGCDKILGLMRRRYTRDIFASRIKCSFGKTAICRNRG